MFLLSLFLLKKKSVHDSLFLFVLIFSGSDYVTYTELENSSELTLTVHFVGEPGQITRLFPQSILRGMGYPLDIQVILKVTDCQVTQLSCVLP